MASKIDLKVPGQAIRLIPHGEGSMVYKYVDGKRSEKVRELNGKPMMRYSALVSTDGVSCLGDGYLYTTSEIVPSFGEVFKGLQNQQAIVSISPRSEFETRLSVTVESIIPDREIVQK